MKRTRLFFEYAIDRTKRIARVSAYFGAVTLILGTIATRRVYGSVEKGALEIGSGLAQLGDVAGPNYDVKLNGETIHVSSTMTDTPLDDVLDRFEKECREHAGGLDDELNALPAAVQGQVPPDMKGPAGSGTMRTREGDRGMVACLARDADLGYAGTLQALTRFAKSGDLADLGKLRYVMAERAPSGRTHVIGVWTEGSFHIGNIFPSEGDCPGSDLPETYRPEGSRRLLTASVEGAPFGVRIYQAPGTPDEVLAKYDQGMAAQGWSPVRAADQGLEQAGRAFMRGPVDALVTAQPTKDGKGTVVSLVSMPPR
jgi:hypothetical protein